MILYPCIIANKHEKSFKFCPKSAGRNLVVFWEKRLMEKRSTGGKVKMSRLPGTRLALYGACAYTKPAPRALQAVRARRARGGVLRLRHGREPPFGAAEAVVAQQETACRLLPPYPRPGGPLS